MLPLSGACLLPTWINLNGIDGSDLFQPGDGELIPTGEAHVRDEADFFWPAGTFNNS